MIGLAWWFGTILLGLVVDPISPSRRSSSGSSCGSGCRSSVSCLATRGRPSARFARCSPASSEGRGCSASTGSTRACATRRARSLAGHRPPDRRGLGRADPARSHGTNNGRRAARGYTVFTLLGMMLFGRIAWLRNAELFEVYLGWFGRVGPWGDASSSSRPARDARRSATPGTASTARSVRSRPSPTSAGRSCVRGSPV